ncbi:zinc-binding alcohol dehydrogenase family protein [Conyzicola sp.]|uniref:zinc-binding alcohol dehydrogenase family protein n=1 Tax=Conyzicola sp. TaxID=1969404 RepID=UPI0039897877
MTAATTPANSAAWLGPKHARLAVGPAPYTRPGPDEIVMRNHAVAINPLDWILQEVGTVIYPWIRYPFVVGSDVAGQVVEVGAAVTRFAVGDRVVAQATGSDKDENSSAAGAFQLYSVVRERLASPIPDDLSFAQASVLPLALSTAACGLFQKNQLALDHPTADPVPSGSTLLVWGGSTSVGANAIQLAVAAGYEVITTASPRNFDYVTRLGASRVIDYGSPTAVADLIAAFDGKSLAGAIAVGTGSSEQCAAVVAACEGNRFIAMASTPASFDSVGDGRGRALRLARVMLRIGSSTAVLILKTRLRGIRTSSIWGSSLKNDEVSTLIYEKFLPAALTDGRFVAAPEALVVGHGLESVQLALDTQRGGVSARKVVVTL